MKSNHEYIAHVRKNPDGTWAAPQLLADHLEQTAIRAEAHAAKFDSGKWGRAIGLAHDAGKGREVWQEYIRLKSGYDEEEHPEGKYGKIPHAIHGAKLAEVILGKGLGRVMAYCIAGHHAGLPDWSGAEGSGQASLKFQQSQVDDWEDVAAFISDAIKPANPERPPWPFAKGMDFSLWIRMLFSSLVDADFLDTEAYMDSTQADNRGGYDSIGDLLEKFNRFSEELDRSSADTPVNQIRRDIRAQCLKMGEEPLGIFSLSVPTGGGKTLSSLGFGLVHAQKHGLERIIYVIPYTSIIEQNADVFRAVLGEEQVIEHHSSLDEDAVTLKARLAAENWDAPVIVTTSVQFFESLFAAKPSRCRKLHNIARSVIVLDEAQLVPTNYLGPILETLQLLVDHYQVSVVLSTATQPAFEERNVDGKMFKGLRAVREIMGSREMVLNLYDSLTRYRVQVPEDLCTPTTWEELAAELKQQEQVLCIVSDRKSCRELYRLMPPETIHLSALMCGEHRSEVIRTIKQKLQQKQPVRVISTQLVEAGVDIDFPVVYRALAGLDSIAQAAGRCNREGKLPALGTVIVFVPPKRAPLGILRKAAETTAGILNKARDNPLEYGLYAQFFKELYWKANSLDEEGIIGLLAPDPRECSIFFRTAAERFQIIDSSIQKTILVRYGDSERLIDMLKAKGPERWLMRKLQRYTVNVNQLDFNRMLERGSIEAVWPNIYALTSAVEYSQEIGLLIDETLYDPGQLII